MSTRPVECLVCAGPKDSQLGLYCADCREDVRRLASNARQRACRARRTFGASLTPSRAPEAQEHRFLNRRAWARNPG